MAVLIRTLLAAGGLAMAAGSAFAHVVADPSAAPAGAYQVIRFRIGHGCGEAATTALRIEAPPGLTMRPQPKPGWTLDIQSGPPHTATWRGALPADQFDEFAVLVHLPDQPGVLYFPAIQTCGGEDSQWTEIPDPGEAASALTHPAPSLTVGAPAPAAPSHQH